MFDCLKDRPADGLLALIGLYARDQRSDKIDLGVGVYRDEMGGTAVMRAIKEAESALLATQQSKSYLGPEGDQRFAELLAEVAFGPTLAADPRLAGVQTPGGSGALRLAGELIATARPGARIWLGTPTWPNHEPVFAAAGLSVQTYPYFDVARQVVLFDTMCGTLETAAPGDVVLLHGCCHNPSGADLSETQWRAISEILVRRRLVPLLDFAYHGLGRGLDRDGAGVRMVIETVEEALVAYSCDKNFALYRERTGALFVLARNAREAQTAWGNCLALARVNWSMPPDHGAACVRLVLSSPELRALWSGELKRMEDRLRSVRQMLGRTAPSLAAIADGNGLFAQLPLSPDQVWRLRDEHAVYMAGSGRCNLAGLTIGTVDRFAVALASVGSAELVA